MSVRLFKEPNAKGSLEVEMKVDFEEFGTLDALRYFVENVNVEISEKMKDFAFEVLFQIIPSHLQHVEDHIDQFSEKQSVITTCMEELQECRSVLIQLQSDLTNKLDAFSNLEQNTAKPSFGS
ncbi:MAG: hypothetical protein PVG30_00840 [Gammaproteobacteria bacterium]|jgi:hypothetical protein